MYKICPFLPPATAPSMVIKIEDNLFIPFDVANVDYCRFKNDIISGTELQDADGNVMTPDEAMAFISNLP